MKTANIIKKFNAVLALLLCLVFVFSGCKDTGKKDKNKNDKDKVTSSQTDDSSQTEDTPSEEEETLEEDYYEEDDYYDDYEDYFDPFFYVVSPEPEEHVNNLRPEFVWTDLQDATEYSLVLKQYKDGGYRTIKEIKGITDTSYTPDFDLKENELYRYIVYGYSGGKRYVAEEDSEGTLFIAKWNPKTHPANVGINYEFKDGITEEVLRNYLARDMNLNVFNERLGYHTAPENLRMAYNTGAKYLSRAGYAWLANQEEYAMFDYYKETIDEAHKIDPDIVFEACVFETTGPNVNEFKIPAYVFEYFNLPVEEDRYFDWYKMQYETGYKHKETLEEGEYVSPDMSRLETQMWYFYRSTWYIDAGFEAIHLGSTPTLIDIDAKNGYEGFYKVTTLIRKYAKEHARRGWVILNAHCVNMTTPDNHLVMDYNCWMLCAEVPNHETAGVPTEDNPQELTISIGGNPGSAYGKTTGGIHPAGFTLERAIYTVELDNYNSMTGDDLDKPQFYSGGMYPWGYCEIDWYARQPAHYRRQWIEYAYKEVQKIDPYGYFAMPGMRTCGAALDIMFRANLPEWRYHAAGQGDEPYIRAIWVEDAKNRNSK